MHNLKKTANQLSRGDAGELLKGCKEEYPDLRNSRGVEGQIYQPVRTGIFKSNKESFLCHKIRVGPRITQN